MNIFHFCLLNIWTDHDSGGFKGGYVLDYFLAGCRNFPGASVGCMATVPSRETETPRKIVNFFIRLEVMDNSYKQ